MLRNNTDPSSIDFDIKEQTRLIILIAILATAVSLYVSKGSMGVAINFLSGLIVLPATGAFLYLIMTGSYLKYHEPKNVGELYIPNIFRMNVYDFTINIFWIDTYVFICYLVWHNVGSIGLTEPWDFIVGVSASTVVVAIYMLAGLKYYRKEANVKNKHKVLEK